jgi:hypothetical protein
MVARFKGLPTSGQFREIADVKVKRDAITFFDDITADATDWRNRCFAAYFGLQKVTLTANHLGLRFPPRP